MNGTKKSLYPHSIDGRRSYCLRIGRTMTAPYLIISILANVSGSEGKESTEAFLYRRTFSFQNVSPLTSLSVVSRLLLSRGRETASYISALPALLPHMFSLPSTLPSILIADPAHYSSCARNSLWQGVPRSQIQCRTVKCNLTTYGSSPSGM